ncbi:transposase family protein [Leptolyngbya sp. PCC 7375]|nr:transposase family protein [Leptolyngbya sp. PCC 7375]
MLDWVKHTITPGHCIYVTIDRTRWGTINLLMVSLVWQRRGILLWCEQLDKQGNSNYDEQLRVLSPILAELCAYKVVVLGDREFCSVKLGRWLGKAGVYFCLRLKRNTEVKSAGKLPQQLQGLGVAPGQQLFLNDVQVTQTQGFGGFNVAAKWKKRYRGFAPDEAWFILTNLETIDLAIKGYAKRFSIEEMFRDYKDGGYCLEGCKATGERLITIVILIALAHTCATLQGQTFKQQGVQAYIARPESLGASQKRHSAFRVGLSAYRWVGIGDTVLQQLAATLMQLTPNKLPEYQRGQRAMRLAIAGL